MPNVDLTVKKSKTRPFDLSAIDVGQSYQHVNIEHSSPTKNSEEYEQSNVVHHSTPRPKLNFNQQTYHDINSMGQHKLKANYPTHSPADDDSDDLPKAYKGFYLPKTLNREKGNSESLTTVSFDGSKLPKILKNHDDDEERLHDEPVDAPIQIINGIPVANPYNIDMNTLK